MDELLLYLNLGEYSPEALGTVLSAAFVAGLARGFSGFGGALIWSAVSAHSAHLVRILLYGHYRIAYMVKDDGNGDILGVSASLTHRMNWRQVEVR